jgi:hypothetical protein
VRSGPLLARIQRNTAGIMSFWQFIIVLALVIFILWNIWMAIRSLGDIGDDD